MQSSARRALAVGAACVVVLAWFAWRSATGAWTHGFSSYYTAARVLLAGELGLLGYPRLYAAALLWMAVLAAMRRERQVGAPTVPA